MQLTAELWSRALLFHSTPVQFSSVQFSPVSGYLKPNLGFGDESAAGGHVYQGSAYKFAAKLSPAQRDPQQGQFLYQREGPKKNSQLVPHPPPKLCSERISDRIASYRIASRRPYTSEVRHNYHLYEDDGGFSRALIFRRGQGKSKSTSRSPGKSPRPQWRRWSVVLEPNPSIDF